MGYRRKGICTERESKASTGMEKREVRKNGADLWDEGRCYYTLGGKCQNW